MIFSSCYVPATAEFVARPAGVQTLAHRVAWCVGRQGPTLLRPCGVCVQGRIFMTHPTKAIYYNLLTDFAKLAAANAEAPLFDKKDVEATMERIEVVDFDQTIDVNGIKVRVCAKYAMGSRALRLHLRPSVGLGLGVGGEVLWAG